MFENSSASLRHSENPVHISNVPYVDFRTLYQEISQLTPRPTKVTTDSRALQGTSSLVSDTALGVPTITFYDSASTSTRDTVISQLLAKKIAYSEEGIHGSVLDEDDDEDKTDEQRSTLLIQQMINMTHLWVMWANSAQLAEVEKHRQILLSAMRTLGARASAA